MQCSVVLILWLGVELVHGGAVRCVPGENSVCAVEQIESVHPARMAKALSGKEIGVSRGVYCLVGSEWNSSCGFCRCSDEGRAVCQRREGCEATDKELETQCAPDTMWRNDCNTCWCSDQGRAMCTRMGCSYVVQKDEPSEESSPAKSVSEATVKSSTNRSTKQVCVANRMFIKDCNTCWCNEDGTSFFCTRKVCVPELPEPGVDDKSEDLRVILKECRPDEVFELDCNMCRCNPDGKSYSCTRRACVDVDLVVQPVDQVVLEPVVQDAKVLPPTVGQDAVVAPVDVQVVQPVGQPVDKPVGQDARVVESVGAVVKDAMVNPVDVQTVQPVDQPVAEPVAKAENQPLVRKSRATEEVRKNCQPGQEFRMDCNTCLCDNEGNNFSCTRHDCNSPADPARSKREAPESAAQNVTMQCVAGSVFNRDCNVCRCADDGQRALCTHKQCVAPASTDTSAEVAESDPNFRCNPGEQLKRGCNDCQCSADGRSVFCTVRFCDQDITPPPPNV